MKRTQFAVLVTHLSRYYVKKIAENKKSINHIFINIDLVITLNSYKQSSVSDLLNAAVRSRLKNVSMLRILFLVQVLCLCLYLVQYRCSYTEPGASSKYKYL